MPASYVHQCIARRALAERLAPGELLDAALAGAEGPDSFFYAIAPNPGGIYPPRLGSLIHTQRTDDFLLALTEVCAGSELTRAYALGFFTHYAADTTFHPFICAHSRTSKGRYSGNAHCLLEARLETLHYRRTGHPNGLPVQFAGFEALDSAAREQIARALSEAVARVFPEHALSAKCIAFGFDTSLTVCRLLRSQDGTKYRVAGLVPFGLGAFAHAHMMPLTLPREDIANDAHAPWASLWEPDKTRTQSFDDLFAAAVKRASELAACACDVWAGRTSKDALRALTGGLSYGSGIPWRQSCPPGKAPGIAQSPRG